MEVNGVGWIAAIIIGGLAGWLAEQFMKSEMGMFMNILLGIIGAIVLNAILCYCGNGFHRLARLSGYRLHRRLPADRGRTRRAKVAIGH